MRRFEVTLSKPSGTRIWLLPAIPKEERELQQAEFKALTRAVNLTIWADNPPLGDESGRYSVIQARGQKTHGQVHLAINPHEYDAGHSNSDPLWVYSWRDKFSDMIVEAYDLQSTHSGFYQDPDGAILCWTREGPLEKVTLRGRITDELRRKTVSSFLQLYSNEDNSNGQIEEPEVVRKIVRLEAQRLEEKLSFLL